MTQESATPERLSLTCLAASHHIHTDHDKESFQRFSTIVVKPVLKQTTIECLEAGDEGLSDPMPSGLI
jgi:serine/threonine protein phosphatase PrpC